MWARIPRETDCVTRQRYEPLEYQFVPTFSAAYDAEESLNNPCLVFLQRVAKAYVDALSGYSIRARR